MRRLKIALLAIALLGFFSATGNSFANHVQCGDTITQDTTLDSDLIDCPYESPAIMVAADDVTLDLGGHTVDGTGFGLGIHSASDRVTIRNGVVREFGIGLSLGPNSKADHGAGRYFVQALELRNNSNHNGMSIRNSSDNELVGNTGGDRMFLLRAPSGSCATKRA